MSRVIHRAFSLFPSGIVRKSLFRRRRIRLGRTHALPYHRARTHGALRGREQWNLSPCHRESVNGAFRSLAILSQSGYFSEALRKNIQTEKELRASEKRRSLILDGMVKDSTVLYPAALREFELDDMEARLKDDLARRNMTFEQYLEQISAQGRPASGGKKTRDELRATWNDAADKRAKVRLILAEIARKEAIDADEEALSHEIEHAREHYPQADPDALRSHIAHAMRNESVLRFLEGNTEKVGHTSHDNSHV